MNNDQRWNATLTRDSNVDGKFVYAVATTGIYCRPTCPSRRPARVNVRFFDGPSEAERAGFRPCLRCRPREARADTEAVATACRLIEANVDERYDLTSLAEQVGLSASHFQRTFKRLTGVTPRCYADACRERAFRNGLKEGGSVLDATVEAGYGSTSRLYERSSSQLGMTPTNYRNGGDRRCIRYAVTETDLGALLVAATEIGLCSVALGDTEEALRTRLEIEFPNAALAPDERRLRVWVEAIVRHLRGENPDLSLPTDVRATAFQRRVWQELQKIPYGETRSYAEVADRIGSPKAVRAVAGACASNEVALVVPCHRVVRSDGGSGGYRWGESRKRELLARERRPRAE